MARQTRPHRVVMKIEQLTADRELWCHDCLLCTGTRVWVAVTCEGVTSLQPVVWCSECEGDNIDLEDAD